MAGVMWSFHGVPHRSENVALYLSSHSFLVFRDTTFRDETNPLENCSHYTDFDDLSVSPTDGSALRARGSRALELDKKTRLKKRKEMNLHICQTSLRSPCVADYAHATPSIQHGSTTGRGVWARGCALPHWWLGDITRLGFRLGRLRPAQHRFLGVPDVVVRWWISSMGTLRHLVPVDCGLGWRITNVASLATARDYERRTFVVMCAATRKS